MKFRTVDATRLDSAASLSTMSYTSTARSSAAPSVVENESTRPSSAATSPAPSESDSGAKEEEEDDSIVLKNDASISAEVKYIEDMDADQRYNRLQFLLEKSSTYASILHKQMDLVKAKSKLSTPKPTKPARGRRSRGGQKRRKVIARADSDEEADADEEEEDGFRQPALVTGGTLKDYQLEGVAWMCSLWENGISGILADEMGLGKTLQTISFCAYLRERTNMLFLIVCPLSVLHNWIVEFEKFAPDIPTCMYHGTPDHRAELRRTVMRNPDAAGDEDASEKAAKAFPVVVTTYELIIKDRKHLSKYKWGYIVVDEGHRLKNFNSKLMQEIKKYPSAGRMILTGTPLHNNLSELWSLLNFILPDIFGDLGTFQEWFNIPTMQESLTSSQTTNIITSLHNILKPFLLRRLKADVEYNLPPKKEYVLYAPLTERQKGVYDAVVAGSLRNYLIDIKQRAHHDESVKEEEKKDEEEEKKLSEGRTLRKRGKKRNYEVDGSDNDDEEYFRKIEAGEIEPPARWASLNEDPIVLSGKEHIRKNAIRQVNDLRLQNAAMQLRKVCSHPFLFDWPVDPTTGMKAVNDDLLNASGKMLLLDQLLTELFKRKHKVLIFSQFTTMLDIIEDWATEYKGWPFCRIDGSSSPLERREQMRVFQESGDAPDAPRLFLLSTRAGGLGINLTAADTVIFYDQDWNPQMDMQAQDRAHRIGQTKPVLIFRLVTKKTIENHIMGRATEKRKLEALVIAKGKFKAPGSLETKKGQQDSLAEIAASLLKLEGEQIDIVKDEEVGKTKLLSDRHLDELLDRSPEVFAGRAKGWAATADGGKSEDGKAKTTFEVVETVADEGNDALANMLGEDVED